MYARCPECEEDVPVADPPESPDLHCPTCETTWTPSPGDPDTGWRVPTGGAVMWAKVLERWETEKVHKAFTEFCLRAGALDYAARRYRRRIDRHGDDERAQASLQRIQVLALSALKPSERPGHVPAVVRYGTALVVAAGLIWVLVMLLSRLGYGV